MNITDQQRQDFVSELWRRIDVSPPEAESDPGKARWKCGEGEDRLFHARHLAAEWKIDLADVTAGTHCCCDCEVVFNVGDDEG